jgi:putative oxidoreductase
MTPLTGTTSRRIDAALVLLRGVVGLLFVAHGAQKLFAFGIDGTIAAFEQMGIPAASIVAPTVAIVELAGGFLLLLGLATRFAAAALAINMLAAIVLVHLPSGFFLPQGVEFALTLMVANIALVLTGAGVHSVDAWLAMRRGHWLPSGDHITVQRHA